MQLDTSYIICEKKLVLFWHFIELNIDDGRRVRRAVLTNDWSVLWNEETDLCRTLHAGPDPDVNDFE